MSVAPAQTGAQLDPGLRRDDEVAAFVKTFPCTSCGAKLAYAPGTRELRCEFCGASNAIAEEDARVEELDIDAYLRELEGHAETFEAETVKCAKCGAEQDLPEHHFASHCSFCASPIVSKGYASRRIKPRGVVPFQVDRQKALDAFRRWVAGLWLAPKELKRYAQTDAALTGVYLPFWTYDCRTDSHYVGERGEVYYTNEDYTTTDSSGKTVTRTRRVEHVNWSPASGRVRHFHDDVLVLATNTLPQSLRGAAQGWKLDGIVAYKPEFVSGYRAEAYQVGLREGFALAKHQIDVTVDTLVRRDIGGDRQRVQRVNTGYSDTSFKHVLLPVWICAYRFRDKTFRFLVNGQTGEVAGESPLSWFKVTWLVVAVALFFLLVYLFSR